MKLPRHHLRHWSSKLRLQRCKKNPEANRAILGPPFFKGLYQFRSVDISVAVEKSLPYLPGQAFATPIEKTLEKSLVEITEELRQLASCDESNNLRYRMFMRVLPTYAPDAGKLNEWF
jgi:hypothetical protein